MKKFRASIFIWLVSSSAWAGLFSGAPINHLKVVRAWNFSGHQISNASISAGKNGEYQVKALIEQGGKLVFLNKAGEIKRVEEAGDGNEAQAVASRHAKYLALMRRAVPLAAGDAPTDWDLTVFDHQGNSLWSQQVVSLQALSDGGAAVVEADSDSGPALQWCAAGQENSIRFEQFPQALSPEAQSFSSESGFCSGYFANPSTLFMLKAGQPVWVKALDGVSDTAKTLLSAKAKFLLASVIKGNSSMLLGLDHQGNPLWNKQQDFSLEAKDAFSPDERFVGLAGPGSDSVSLLECATGRALWTREYKSFISVKAFIPACEVSDIQVSGGGIYLALATTLKPFDGLQPDILERASKPVLLFDNQGNLVGRFEAHGSPKLRLVGNDLFVIEPERITQLRIKRE